MRRSLENSHDRPWKLSPVILPSLDKGDYVRWRVGPYLWNLLRLSNHLRDWCNLRVRRIATTSPELISFSLIRGFKAYCMFVKIPASELVMFYTMEPTCGRPLGLKFNRKTCQLYIANAYLVGSTGGKAKSLATKAEKLNKEETDLLIFDFIRTLTRWKVTFGKKKTEMGQHYVEHDHFAPTEQVRASSPIGLVNSNTALYSYKCYSEYMETSYRNSRPHPNQISFHQRMLAGTLCIEPQLVTAPGVSKAVWVHSPTPSTYPH
ncbi:hypothetical protein Syun_020989 [Stephania yunnanensis]|uniref:Uncharacterized protein n=1 Tax=Stephania yunnanensis TaxID=152371 RepID=A0AAP0IF77_9MAGN